MAIAFDSATDGSELAGDGVITISHTATGSNLAAFAGGGSGAATSSTATYNSVAMTELWDTTYGFADNGGIFGYQLSGIPSGTVNVVNTLSNTTPIYHGFGVITLTGVHQTTPVGTAATAKGQSTAPSVTSPDAAIRDVVIDCLFSDGSVTATGADQTIRNSEDITDRFLRQSTQDGSAGGVMSWTINSNFWGTGCVAFKPFIPTLPLLGVGA